jgi:hypothetical protein
MPWLMRLRRRSLLRIPGGSCGMGIFSGGFRLSGRLGSFLK